jgi:hypothetical protein
MPINDQSLFMRFGALVMGPVIALALAGCSTSQVSSLQNSNAPKALVKTIAMMPGGGLLADAVVVNKGFTIIDPAGTSSLMIRLNLDEVEISRPEGLAKFRSQGIDAILAVKTAGGYDQQPQSASARMNSTTDGRVIAGTTWQNGFGGEAGSIADRVMRQGLSQAASQIANELASRIRTQ